MKIKTSVKLSEDVLQSIDELAGNPKDRSRIVETAVIYYLKAQKADKRNLNDLDILNEKADELNQEAADVLSYQRNR